MTRRLRLGIMLAVFGLLMAAVVYFVGNAPRPEAGQQAGERPEEKMSVKDLAERCVSSGGGQGKFGEMTIDRKVVVSNEAGEIPVPCKINLSRGGELFFNEVNLKTKHLVVNDQGTNGENRVSVENSTILGGDQSGFFMRLSDASDRFSVHRSTFDYPLSFWANVIGEADKGGGRIDVTASEIRSSSPKSEGIHLVTSDAGGIGRFIGLKLKTVALDPKNAPGLHNVLLVADDCVTERVEGHTGFCDPDDAARAASR